MAIDPLEPPPDWTKDSLSDYFERAQRHRYATFVHLKAEFDLLNSIDGLCMALVENHRDPKSSHEITLLFRAHSAFRVICQAATAGQVVESFVAARSCLEYAGYAVLIQSRPELSKIWFDRHVDNDSRKLVRNEFKVAAILDAIGKVSTKLQKIYGNLYDLAIDFGAHPNERGFSASALIEEKDGLQFISQVYLHDNNLMLKFGLKNAARVGMMMTELASVIVPQRAIDIEYPKFVAPILREAV